VRNKFITTLLLFGNACFTIDSPRSSSTASTRAPSEDQRSDYEGQLTVVDELEQEYSKMCKILSRSQTICAKLRSWISDEEKKKYLQNNYSALDRVCETIEKEYNDIGNLLDRFMSAVNTESALYEKESMHKFILWYFKCDRHFMEVLVKLKLDFEVFKNSIFCE
jgi:hypothetical protein